MPLDDDLAFPHDMLSYARTVGRLVQGKSSELLKTDEMFRLALERAIEVIGEAARGVSKATTTAHPEVP